MVNIQLGHGSPVTLYGTDDVAIDANNPLPIGSTVASTWATNQVTVSATAVLILAANTSRDGATVSNPGPTTIYIGFANTVTAATGLPVLSGAGYNIDNPLYKGDIYGITASGQQVVGRSEMS